MMSIAEWLAGQDTKLGQTATVAADCFGGAPIALPFEEQLANRYQNGFGDGQRAAAAEYAMALTKEREDLHHSAEVARRQWLEIEAASTLASVDEKLEDITGVIERRLVGILAEFLEARIAEQAIRAFHATLEEFLRQRKPEIVRLSAPPEFHARLQLLMQAQERQPDMSASDSPDMFAGFSGGGFETAIGLWAARLKEAADE